MTIVEMRVLRILIHLKRFSKTLNAAKAYIAAFIVSVAIDIGTGSCTRFYGISFCGFNI